MEVGNQSYTLPAFNAGEEAKVIANAQTRWTEIIGEGINTGTKKRQPSVPSLTVGISVFSLKFLQPSVEKWSNLPLSWRMVSPLTLVNWLCSPQTDKDGNKLVSGIKTEKHRLKRLFHKIQTIYLVQTLQQI